MERYHLLGISRDRYTMFQGDRHGFTEIVPAQDEPRTLKEVLGKQLTDPYVTHGAYGGTGGRSLYHGHGDAKQEIDKDTEKFLRYVDNYVMENYSKPSKLPLILVSLLEYHSLFRDLSSNPYLIDAGIEYSYESLEMDELKNKALEIIEPINLEKMRSLVESYKRAEADSMGSSDLVQVAKAAYNSQVETVLIEENRIVPGKIDYNTGAVNNCVIGDPDCDDILDDIAELTLMRRGNVWILPKDKMPSTTGVSAIYRYKMAV